MPRHLVSVGLPESTWIHDLSVRAPGSTVRVLAALDGGSEVGILEVRSPHRAGVLASMESSDQRWDLLASRRDRWVLRVEALDAAIPPGLLAAATDGAPLALADGVAHMRLEGSIPAMREMVGSLEEAGIPCALLAPDGERRIGGTLTPRQREVLGRAVELGYYDTPRRSTLTAVAAELGITKSTASDILHRAEGKVVRGFLQDPSGAAPSGSPS